MQAFRLGPAHFAAALLTCLFLLVAAVPARADDASLGRVGECVRPIDNNSVTMADEEITVKAGQERSEVTCRFTFRNDGPATSVLMGFPGQNLPEEREGFADDVSIHDFTATADGEPLDVEVRGAVEDKFSVPGSSSMRDGDWWTFTVPFAAGQERVIVNAYWVKNLQWSNGEVAVGYTLVTGRNWNGPIGHITVKVTPDGWSVADLTRAFPGGYTVDQSGTMGWEWDSIEPGGNILVHFNHRAAELNPQVSDGIAAWEQAVAADTDDPQTVWLLAKAYLSKYGLPSAGRPVNEVVSSLDRHARAHAERELLTSSNPGGWRNEAWIGVSRMVSAIAGAPRTTLDGQPPLAGISWECADDVFKFILRASDSDGDMVGYTAELYETDGSDKRRDVVKESSADDGMAGDGRSLTHEWSGFEIADDVYSLTYRVTVTDFTGLVGDSGEVTLYRRSDGTLSPTKPGPALGPWCNGLYLLVLLALIAVILGRRRPARPE